MYLSQWIKAHHGTVARIGAKNGAGFVFAGLVDGFTLNRIYRRTQIDMRLREVIEVYPSTFAGVVVLIAGSERGTEECPQYDRKHTLSEEPIEAYQRLADAVAQTCAVDYEHALIKWYTAVRERDRNNADSEIFICERFFRSDSFALMMPNVNGETVLRLINDKVANMVKHHD